MSIPKDLAKKRDELTQNYYDKYVCGDKPSFVDGFNAGVLAAFESEHVQALVKALEYELEVTINCNGINSPKYDDLKIVLAKWEKRNEV